MKNLEEKTPTELLVLSNKIKERHEKIKRDIISLTKDVEKIEIEINNKAKELGVVEDDYMKVMEELSKRQKV